MKIQVLIMIVSGIMVVGCDRSKDFSEHREVVECLSEPRDEFGAFDLSTDIPVRIGESILEAVSTELVTNDYIIGFDASMNANVVRVEALSFSNESAFEMRQLYVDADCCSVRHFVAQRKLRVENIQAARKAYDALCDSFDGRYGKPDELRDGFGGCVVAARHWLVPVSSTLRVRCDVLLEEKDGAWSVLISM